MKSEVRGLAMVCTISLALMATMMVPGLLLQPSIVKAQAHQPNMTCSAGGVTGCVTCPFSSGFGCSPGGSPAGGYKVGACVANNRTECLADTLVCGSWISCTTGKPNGNKCSTFGICL